MVSHDKAMISCGTAGIPTGVVLDQQLVWFSLTGELALRFDVRFVFGHYDMSCKLTTCISNKTT